MDPNELKLLEVYFHTGMRKQVCFLFTEEDGNFLFVPVRGQKIMGGYRRIILMDILGLYHYH
jgi:hypothetical protein